jgi:hypothetical protein
MDRLRVKLVRAYLENPICSRISSTGYRLPVDNTEEEYRPEVPEFEEETPDLPGEIQSESPN